MSPFVPGEVPIADEVTADYWAATRSHLLTVQACSACGHRQHPPRALCTGCGGIDQLTQIDVSGTGTLDTYTVVHRPPRAGVETPYVVARVRLAEGPVVLTRLLGEHDWAIGDPVVAWVDLPDGRSLPVFHHPEETA